MVLLEWTDGFNYAIEFDAAEVYGYEDTNETTDRAIERGGFVTDHVKSNSGTITVEGTITNSPLRALAPTRDRSVSNQSVRLKNGSSVVVQVWDSPFDRVRLVDELLLEMMTVRPLMTLTTGLRTTEEIVCVRYAPKKDGTTGNGLAVVMEFKKLRFATSQRAVVTPVQRRMIPPQQRGAQPADNRTGEARLEDAATNLFNRAFGG